MNITNKILQSGAPDWIRKSGVATSENKVSTASKSSKADSAAFSSAALQKSQTAESTVLARVNALPEVREERVAEVKQRVQSGFYNTSEFTNTLADTILKNPFGG
jgi:anti-sigma28 factor (negative regulator of flagellin synthesis)